LRFQGQAGLQNREGVRNEEAEGIVELSISAHFQDRDGVRKGDRNFYGPGPQFQVNTQKRFKVEQVS